MAGPSARFQLLRNRFAAGDERVDAARKQSDPIMQAIAAPNRVAPIPPR